MICFSFKLGSRLLKPKSYICGNIFFYQSLIKHQTAEMSVFTQRLNPITGRLEWEEQPENYDFNQEVARSGYADMLHDVERNQKYYTAIRMAVEKVHASGRDAHVLDIGTGTGLLSMMAARCGAETITACEGFPPMAKCALQVIRENNLEERIKLVVKRSTEMKVGRGLDMERRANILVTEVFDTELIGEGAIETFNHAHRDLLEKDCVVVPSVGTVYAQVIESEFVTGWTSLRPIALDENTSLVPPPSVQNCPGGTSLQDFQLSQMPQDKFRALSDPVPVLRFDWRCITPKKHSSAQSLVPVNSGRAHAVFVWWELEMFPGGEVLSCAPWWAHPSKAKCADDVPWRDHWMQAVYHLPDRIELTSGKEVKLVSCHDEFSLWFALFASDKIPDLSSTQVLRPRCTCGLHTSQSNTRIGALNDVNGRWSRHIRALRDFLRKIGNGSVLCLSEGSLLAPIAASMGARDVYCIETQNQMRWVLNDYIDANGLEGKIHVVDISLDGQGLETVPDDVSGIIGDPHFSTALLPWHNLYFWYLRSSVKLSKKLSVLPRKATMMALPVQFQDLWKIRAPLGSVEGFDLKSFDVIIQEAMETSDAVVEAQPLWEYPCKALAFPYRILEFNFGSVIGVEASEVRGKMLIEGSGICNGIALWMEWDLDGDPKNVISTGPISPPMIGERVRWDPHCRQGVHLFPRPRDVAGGELLSFHVRFLPDNGDFQFNFSTKGR